MFLRRLNFHSNYKTNVELYDQTWMKCTPTKYCDSNSNLIRWSLFHYLHSLGLWHQSAYIILLVRTWRSSFPGVLSWAFDLHALIKQFKELWRSEKGIFISQQWSWLRPCWIAQMNVLMHVKRMKVSACSEIWVLFSTLIWPKNACCNKNKRAF